MPTYTLEMVLAAYPDDDAAGRGWERLRALDQAGEIVLEDGAVVTKDADGKVHIDERRHHSVKKGALIGAAVALALPVGVLAGALAGAVGGKLYKHLKGNLDKGDARTLGQVIDRNSSMVLAVVPPGEVAKVEAELGDATETFHQRVTSTDAAFAELWAQEGHEAV